MNDVDEENILSELSETNLIRRQIAKPFPSFLNMNNFVDVFEFMKCNLEGEKIERSVLLYKDIQSFKIKCGDEYDPASNFLGLSNLEVVEDVDSKDFLDKSRTFFGEPLLLDNYVSYFSVVSIEEWKVEDLFSRG
uniref:Uncharacterized protein n=1 Tax=Strongyloides papillosus TaxID=174720 RepID=A0A0N5BTH9_STREA